MKAILLFTLVIFSVSNFFAQEDVKNSYYAVKSFVKEDTVLLRWAPLSSELLERGLKYGFTVERIEVSKGSEFENNKSLKSFSIEPFNKDKEGLTQEEKEVRTLIQGYLSSSLSEAEQEYLYSVLLLSSGSNKIVSSSLNLSYVDTEVDNQKTYKYRVGLIHKYPKSTVIKVNANLISSSKEMSLLFGEGDNKRKEGYLKWEAASLQSDYSAYWIERSIDSVNFQRVNETPYIFFKSSDEKEKTDIDFVDNSVEEGVTYWYRVSGINHFAEVEKVSNVVKISMKRILKGAVQIDTIYADNFDRLVKGSYHPKDKKDLNKLKGFVLMKSKEMHNNFSIVETVLQTDFAYEFSVTSALSSGDNNYFKVGAISVDDDTIYSYTRYFFTLDQIPPIAPIGLMGVIDSTGVATLEWEPNSEEDIRGYRVFRSNSMREEFVEVTTSLVNSNGFNDTLPLNNLTSDIYYRIAAVDLNFNNSDHCEAVKLMKPDTIAPVSCVFIKYESEMTGMLLKWNNSNSTDLSSNQLIRMGSNGTEQVIYTWLDSSISYVDTLAELGVKSTYKLRSIDQSDNISDSRELTVVYETGKRPSVDSLMASVDLEKRVIMLTWNNPSAEIYSLKLYRSKNNSPYRLLKTTKDFASEQFEDKDLYINNQYSYKMKVVYKSGVNSDFSDIIDVVF